MRPVLAHGQGEDEERCLAGTGALTLPDLGDALRVLGVGRLPAQAQVHGVVERIETVGGIGGLRVAEVAAHGVDGHGAIALRLERAAPAIGAGAARHRA